jgi:hypothetical protein
VGESAVQLGVILATSDPVVGDANINNQITRSRRIREVVDDFEVPALQARARLVFPRALTLAPYPANP